MPLSKNNPYSKFNTDKKFEDAQREARRLKREQTKNDAKVLADIRSGARVNFLSHTPPYAQEIYQVEEFHSLKKKMRPEFGGGKKRTNKMLKKRRRTKKRT